LGVKERRRGEELEGKVCPKESIDRSTVFELISCREGWLLLFADKDTKGMQESGANTRQDQKQGAFTFKKGREGRESG